MYHRKPILPTSIVFLGDSLTEAFELEEYFKNKNLVNRGLSGDTTMQVLYRMEEIVKGKPSKLFLMIGINDLFNDYPPDKVWSNIREIIERFIEETPQTELIVQSVLPVRENLFIIEEDLNRKVYQVNDHLRIYCKKKSIKYIDLHSHFLDQNGQMDAAYTYDGAHLTERGYGLWAEVISPHM